MDEPDTTLTPEALMSGLSALETLFGVPSGSIGGLLADSDWSAIIKAHALVEGAVTAMLSVRLEPRLRPVLARLPLGADFGKLSFTKSLDLLSADDRAFVGKLSELRNKLAHDPTQLNFNLSDYVAGLDEQQRAAFHRAFRFTGAGVDARWAEFVEGNPKGGVVLRTIGLLLTCALAAHQADTDRARLAAYEKGINELGDLVRLQVKPDERE